jgi:hypothetical protein
LRRFFNGLLSGMGGTGLGHRKLLMTRVMISLKLH